MSKRSVIVDGDGGPLGVVIAGANVHGTKLLEQTIDAMIVERPDPGTHAQHLALDKGYDHPTGRSTVEKKGCTGRIRRIGEEKVDQRGRKARPARRWVVERALAWLSKRRVILVCFAKKSCNYLAIIQLACILLWFRRLRRRKGAI
ncbi:MAG: transposase [Phycisphaerales bacterium]